MNYRFLLLMCFFGLGFIQAQNTDENEALLKAEKALGPTIEAFMQCLKEGNTGACVTQIVTKATDTNKAFLIGGILYNIDPEHALALHQRAYKEQPKNVNFIREYAIELHRSGAYDQAIELYLEYAALVPKDYRVHVWLSECYLNIGEVEKAIEEWKASDFQNNHTGIDFAIHVIHGRTDQFYKRSALRTSIKNKDVKSAYELVYMDRNWELDWWNNKEQNEFLEEDLKLIASTFGTSNPIYKTIETYLEIVSNTGEFSDESAEIKSIFETQGILVKGGRIIPGKIGSDLMRIAISNDLIDSNAFYNQRKEELWQLAEKYQDIELLNSYAHLEGKVTGKVSAETDKKGWTEFKDERFAMSYFIGLGNNNTYDSPELAKALLDFPESVRIQLVKFTIAALQDKPYKKDLIKLIELEFKSLGSDPFTYCKTLNGYFYVLENGIKK